MEVKLPATFVPRKLGNEEHEKAKLGLAINISAMTDFDNQNSLLLIINRINDAIVALSDSVFFLCRQFFTFRRSRTLR